METKNIKTLLGLMAQNEFCIQTEDGKYEPIADNAEGKIRNVISCLGQELFGHWPLNDEEEVLLKKLTSLKYNPSKKPKSRNKATRAVKSKADNKSNSSAVKS